MRSLRHVLTLSLFLIAAAASAQAQNLTDAQIDGLAGPVKSVSTNVTYSGVKWQQPGGPLAISCRDCEYDPDGTRTKSGVSVEGRFQGVITRLVRDATGRVTGRFVVNASTGEMVRHEVMGPFGKTEQTVYLGGELRWRNTFSYDQYGHMTDWTTFDGTGRQEGRILMNTAKRWHRLREVGLGKKRRIRFAAHLRPRNTSGTLHYL